MKIRNFLFGELTQVHAYNLCTLNCYYFIQTHDVRFPYPNSPAAHIANQVHVYQYTP